MKNNKYGMNLIFIAVIVSFLYVSGIPGIYFPPIYVEDVEPIYIALIINIVIAMIIGLTLVRIFTSQVKLGFQRKNIKQGFLDYWFSCFIAFIIPFMVFCFDLKPLDYRPTTLKVLIECVFYYIGVGIIEEFFARGLLLNGIEKVLKGSNVQLRAICLSALIFGAGHIVGMIGSTPFHIASKVVWTVGLGIYLGAIYVKTRNLWLVSIFHAIIDLCALPFCFSLQTEYSEVSAFIIAGTFLLIGVYGIYLIKKVNFDHLD